jgi:hypothetical protein
VNQRGRDRIGAFRPAVGVEDGYQLPWAAPLDFLPAGDGGNSVGLAATGTHELLFPAAPEFGFGRVGLQEQPGQQIELVPDGRQLGEDCRRALVIDVLLHPQVADAETAHQQRHAHASQHAEFLVGRHDDGTHRRRNSVRKLPRLHVHWHPLAEQEVHPDAVRVRLV